MNRSSARFAAALVGVVVLAGVLRGIECARTELMFDDTAHYVDMARMLLEGRFADVARHPYHPLFAAGIAAAMYVVPDGPSAAMLLSVLAGALAALPLALVWRVVSGRTVAWVAGLAYAVSPYPIRYAAAGQSEALFFLLFFTAVLLAVLTLSKGRATLALACGLASGLAYLVRPEGAGVFAVLIAALLLRLPLRRDLALAARFRPLLGCVLAFLILGAPYVAYKYQTTGSFQITGKKSISKMLGLGKGEAQEPPPLPGIGDRKGSPWPDDLLFVANTYVGALYAPFFGLAVVGVLFTRGHRRRAGPELLLAALFVAYGILHLLLLRSYGYLSRRHAVPLACLALGWSAMGFLLLNAWGRMLLGRIAPRRRTTWMWVVPTVLTVAFAGACLPKALRRQWWEQAPIRDAGEWFAARRGEDPSVRVCTPYQWGDPRIPVYAGLPIDQPTLFDAQGMLAWFETTKPSHLAVLPHRLARACADAEAVRNHPRLEKVWSAEFLDGSGESVEIYRFLDADAARPEGSQEAR